VTNTLNKLRPATSNQRKAGNTQKHCTARKRSGRIEEKQLLILLSSINIFELIEAKHLDYKMIDAILASIKFLKLPKPEQNHGQPPHPFV
jgi:hypothetical protein